MHKQTRETLEKLTAALFWVHSDGQLTWCNESGSIVLKDMVSKAWSDISQSLPDGYIYHIHEGTKSENGFLVECVPDNPAPGADEIREYRERVDQLELIFQEMFDEVYVTDGAGITLRVNKATERLYGIEESALVGRSVYELERERVFYPSGIAEVLRRRTQVTFLQSTQNGKRLISTATPVFGDNGEIVIVISTAKDVSEIPWFVPSNVESAPDESDDRPQFGMATTRNQPMLSLIRLAQKVAPTDATLLLLGETGVGKNLMAEYIHEQSARRNYPLIDVNCAAIPESLLESELFGYEGGAFTGALRGGKPGKVELAHRGTLFLNEVAELPLHLQGKLLDFIQSRSLFRVGGTTSKQIDTRIIAATNRNLEDMVKEGLFRADLFYRLNVVPIKIPALRNRMEDIEDLAVRFLSQLSSRYHQPMKTLSVDTIHAFREYQWPGNIRELENLMERIVLTVDERIIHPCHLPDNMRDFNRIADFNQIEPRLIEENRGLPKIPTYISSDGGSPLRFLEIMERSIYEEALRQHHSTYKIAEVLGVSQPTVVRKLKQLGLR